jgi:hypothetical protein
MFENKHNPLGNQRTETDDKKSNHYKKKNSNMDQEGKVELVNQKSRKKIKHIK